MKKKLIILIVFLLFLLSCGGVEETDNDSDETEDIETGDSDTFDGSEVIKFKDVNLEKCVRTKIKKPEGEITVEDVKNVESLYCDEKGVVVIDGVEKIINLNHLSLMRNDIKDFSLLKNLKSLKKLYLDRNSNVDTESLGELNGLEELSVESCDLTELGSIVNLVGLKNLSITSNQLKSIEEVKNLTGLKSININKNYLQNNDLPVLLNLVNLEHLNVEENCLTDFTITNELREKGVEVVVGQQDTTRCK